MKQRKTAKKLAAILLVCVMAFSLVACSSTLDGTYSCKDSLIEQSLTFDEDEVTGTIMGININGTYVIEDDQIIITYSVGPLSYNSEYKFEKDGDSIFIDGTEYKKVN